MYGPSFLLQVDEDDLPEVPAGLVTAAVVMRDLERQWNADLFGTLHHERADLSTTEVLHAIQQAMLRLRG